MDYSPPGSSVHGILQTRILEWVAISFSRGSSQPRDWTHISFTGRQVLYRWATNKALSLGSRILNNFNVLKILFFKAVIGSCWNWEESKEIFHIPHPHTCITSSINNENKVLVTQSCLTLCYPMVCSPPGLSARGFPRQEYQSPSLFPSPGDLPQTGIKPTSPVSCAGRQILYHPVTRKEFQNLNLKRGQRV